MFVCECLVSCMSLSVKCEVVPDCVIGKLFMQRGILKNKSFLHTEHLWFKGTFRVAWNILFIYFCCTLSSTTAATTDDSSAYCYGAVMVPVGQFTSLWRSESARAGALQLIKIQWFSVLLIVSSVGALLSWGFESRSSGWRLVCRVRVSSDFD